MAEDKENVEGKPDVTLPITLLVKAVRTQHGLRHGSYQRYRQFCSRRLRRVRASLKVSHGRRNFQPRKLTPGPDKRYLELPLYQAERAWAFAMEMKEDMEALGQVTRTRYHVNRRLAKAVKWGQQLLLWCNQVADSSTRLEAEAYACWISGVHLLEKQQWKTALEQFMRSQTIYSELAKVADTDMRDVCNERVTEIRPSIRFCRYQLGEEGSDIEIPLIDEVLVGKLEGIISEVRQKNIEALRSIEWRGRKVPIRSEKVRVAFLKSQQALYALQKEESYSQKNRTVVYQSFNGFK